MLQMLAEGFDWSWIITVVGVVTGIGIVAVYIAKARKVLVETKELMIAVINVLTPGGVTIENINTVVKEAKDIPLAIAALISKDKAENGDSK